MKRLGEQSRDQISVTRLQLAIRGANAGSHSSGHASSYPIRLHVTIY